MYGYAPFNPAAAAAYAPPAPMYPMARHPMGMTFIGAETEKPGLWDRTKEALNRETAGVKNGYWLGGAALLGLAWYGHSQRWF